MEAGAKGFVGKPFDVSHMLTTVRNILDEEWKMWDLRCEMGDLDIFSYVSKSALINPKSQVPNYK
jgi:hypothetical protein